MPREEGSWLSTRAQPFGAQSPSLHVSEKDEGRLGRRESLDLAEGCGQDSVRPHYSPRHGSVVAQTRLGSEAKALKTNTPIYKPGEEATEPAGGKAVPSRERRGGREPWSQKAWAPVPAQCLGVLCALHPGPALSEPPFAHLQNGGDRGGT